MEHPVAITLICRDRALLDILDEPLRRDCCKTELLSDIAAWRPAPPNATRRLLVIDLELLPAPAGEELLRHLAAGTDDLLLIPATTSPAPAALPANARLLARRTPQLLIAKLTTLIGFPGRIFPRRQFECDVQIRPQDAKPFSARCFDLGLGGAFIEFPREIASGKRVSLRFSEGHFACDGCVAWQRTSGHSSRPRYGTGIQFLFPDRQRLARLLVPPPS